MLKKRAANFTLSLIVIILFWEVFSNILCVPFIPSPASVLLNLYSDLIPKILIHVLWSLLRIAAGISASIILGMPIGLCMGYYKKLNGLFTPLLYLAYPVPKIALLPVIILVFGLGELSKIFMVVMIILFQIIVALRDAARSIPKEVFYSLTSLGAGAPAIFRRIIVPASMPALITSIRVSMGTALSVLFFTETFGTRYGLGFYIMDSWMRVDYEDMFSGIVALSIVGIVLFIVIDCLENLICRWKHA
jgi:NitT/TauT family transport system permease protein